ncbi:MAG TPA: hypothetical protein VE955_11555 [Candidatus Dormibacteraeota bacterium]|nr:hypothetical protein [Candidatus Dormibacteraeota bacterium]
MRLSGFRIYVLAIIAVGVVVIVVGLLISTPSVEVMRFSGSQSPVFAINGNSKNYFLEPVSQTNFNLCSAPTIVTLYQQNAATPVYNGEVTYYTRNSGGNWELSWNSMFLPDGLTPGNYYLVVQEPSCRTGVTLALFRFSR